ncbi:MAG TPA: hydroxysqualene dehydroxylase HpnE [Caulobacteraceae bacterium]|jgi:squalene-associated FAD-dependent desaturase|nr:hydroxysqualene dehydroxylase HpnE [Caulobacteraceae bacterium]
MSPRRVHVVGAGLAGLSAAVSLAAKGIRVELSEAAGQAGGRCRSYFDNQLGLTIDNGNHLVMSGNHAVMRYLAAIGASDRLAGPNTAEFNFVDLGANERWTLRPNDSALPWWIFARDRRAPGTRASDYLGLGGLMFARPDQRVDQMVKSDGAVWDRLLHPFLLAALNTEPKGGSAFLAGAVVRETLARGGRAFRLRFAEPTLAAAFIEPALKTLEAAPSASVRLNRRLRGVEFENGRVSGLAFGDQVSPVAPEDRVILAVPPWIAPTLIPALSAPDAFCSIVNCHFRLAPPAGAPPITAVLGGTAEWVLAYPDRISVTISGADAIVDEDRDVLVSRIWADVRAVLGLSGEPPPWQIVKERRATFAATPEQNAKRPPARTRWPNLFLAGDWTATGLPATIEGALRSGETAAGLVRSAGP